MTIFLVQMSFDSLREDKGSGYQSKNWTITELKYSARQISCRAAFCRNLLAHDFFKAGRFTWR